MHACIHTYRHIDTHIYKFLLLDVLKNRTCLKGFFSLTVWVKKKDHYSFFAKLWLLERRKSKPATILSCRTYLIHLLLPI